MNKTKKLSLTGTFVKYLIRDTFGNGVLGNKVASFIFLLLGVFHYFAFEDHTFRDGMKIMLIFMGAFVFLLKAGFIELYIDKYGSSNKREHGD